MGNAQAGPNIDEGGLDGESGDIVCTRDSRDVPSLACVSPREADLGTVGLVEDINV